jgi:2-polyprenyl-3-methyl-5-hydroxy-6-metoxy-1,4-benzoquinol methylase
VRRRYALEPFDVYACDSCTIYFRHPLPDAAELVAMYENPRYHESVYFQNAGQGYRRSAPEVRIYGRALADLASMTRPGRLLDVGCGAGVFLDLARDAGWTVSGVELSERHAAHARDTFGLEVWQGDFLEAPFAPASFAAITMWDFLEHVLDPRAVLASPRARAGCSPRGACCWSSPSIRRASSTRRPMRSTAPAGAGPCARSSCSTTPVTTTTSPGRRSPPC